MNKFSAFFASVLAATMAFCNSASAAVPAVEHVGVRALTDCPTNLTHETAYYSDKIVFKITGALTASLAADQAALNALPRNTELDIKVRDDPRKIAHVKNKALTFIGAAPSVANAANIAIVSVSYTVVLCAEAQI